MITQEYVKNILEYDINTGIFKYRKKVANCVKIGDIANFLDSNGYYNVCIKSKTYKAHRLAYFYVYGSWPKGQIDHINGVRCDNRIDNLRDVNQKENAQNKVFNRVNKSLGVSYSKRDKKWRSYTMINYKQHSFGNYNTKEEAIEVYKSAMFLLKEVE
jgi:hypothetical protein